MQNSTLAARTGAVFFALWGLVHIAGATLQLGTLSAGGAGALTAMIASAHPATAESFIVPAPAGAFMGMGAYNILWIGLFVTVIAIVMNWRNSRTGYLINMGVVAATDAGLLFALLIPGHMAWTDGAIGLGLFAVAATFSTIGLFGREWVRAMPSGASTPSQTRSVR